MKNRSAFSLVELSVVIVIFSIMISVVLISRSLIDMAKINKITEEAIIFNNSIKIFFTNYDCIPGDCKQNQVPDLVSGINSACFTTNSQYQKCTTQKGCPDAIPLNTGSIETIAKTTCMMQSLQSAGYISCVNKNATLIDSIAGINLPIAKFSKLAAWDFRLFQDTYKPYTDMNEKISSMQVFPAEFTTLGDGGWQNKNVLFLRQATRVAGQNGNIAAWGYGSADTGWILQSPDSTQLYGISANLTQKLDLKFDDGKPYSGNIMAGISYADMFKYGGLGTDSVSCNTVNIDLIYYGTEVSSNERYLTSKDINRGCIVGFYMDIPT